MEHLLLLVLLPVTIGTLVAVPLGILAARNERVERVVLGIINTIQTIPGLALIAFMIPLGLGIGYRPAIVALFLYSLLPIIRNTCTGIKNINPAVIEADLVVIEDDKQFNPPYHGVLMMKASVKGEYPDVYNLLVQLEGKTSTEEMIALNAEVDVNEKEPSQVARDWVEKNFK